MPSSSHLPRLPSPPPPPPLVTNPGEAVATRSPSGRRAPRIALYHPYPHRMGGSQQVTLLLAEHLPAFGIVPVLLCPEEGVFTAAARELGLEVLICDPGSSWRVYGRGREGLGRWLSPAHLRELFTAWLRLRTLLREHAISLLHCNDTRAVVMAAMGARLARIRVIWHVHTAPARGKRRWLDALCSLATDYRVLVSSALQSEWTLPRWLLGAHGVIPNGIAAGAAALPIAIARDPLIIAVGSLQPGKGFDVLLRALPDIRRHVPRVRLWIAGADWGDGSHEKHLRTLVDELELLECVSFLGQRNDVARLVASSSLVAIPSLSEAFGMVALEAMKEGKPVVASRTGGLRDIVVDGQTGLLVTPASRGELAEAIARLLTNPDEAARMGAAGRHRLEVEYSAMRMAGTFAALYCALAKKPAR